MAVWPALCLLSRSEAEQDCDLSGVPQVSLGSSPCRWVLDLACGWMFLPFSTASQKRTCLSLSLLTVGSFHVTLSENNSVHLVEDTSWSTSTGRTGSEASCSVGGEQGGFLRLGYKHCCLCCFHFPNPLFVQALKQVDLFWILKKN